MKTYLATAMVVGAMGSLLLATGCVSEAQYKEALAASRRANEQLGKCKSALTDLRTENQKLLSDVQARNAVIGAGERSLADLQANHDKLSDDFEALLAKYEKALAGTPVPTPIGPILPPGNINKALSEFAAANPDLVEYLPKYGMVKLKSDLTLAPGSDIVQATTETALAKLVTIVNSAAAAEFNVYVAGHTNDMRIGKPETRRHHPDNWYLSVHRAVSVQKVLVKAGLAPQRVGVLGFSEYHPVAANAPGKKGNQANRRVEIWIVPPDRFLTAASG